jgi:hypothetical protein
LQGARWRVSLPVSRLMSWVCLLDTLHNKYLALRWPVALVGLCARVM